jgi:hypothetical protein
MVGAGPDGRALERDGVPVSPNRTREEAASRPRRVPRARRLVNLVFPPKFVEKSRCKTTPTIISPYRFAVP